MMGRQYAEQAGDLIRERLKLIKAVGTRVSRDTVDQSRIFLNVKAHSVLVEIEYLASTLNEKEEDLLLLSAEPPGVGIRQGGCSSFVIDPKASKDGHVWAGQNIDDAAGLKRFGVVLLRHPANSPPMITWALAGGVGAIGMNLAGITLTMNYLATTMKKRPVAIFPEFVANSALRQKDFKDASAVLTQTPLMQPCGFILGDTAGTRVVFERAPHIFSANTPGELVAAQTNHFTDRRFELEDTGEKVFPNSKNRLNRLIRLLARKHIRLEDLKKALADTRGNPHGICRHAEPGTIASVLMCPAQKKFLATMGRPDQAEYREFTLTRTPDRR